MAGHRAKRSALTVLSAALLPGAAFLGASGTAGASSAGTAGAQRAGAPRGGTERAGASKTVRSERFLIEVNLAASGQKERLTLSGSESGTEAQLDLSAAGQSVLVRRLGNDVYVHLPASVASSLPAGKSWALESLAALRSKLGAGGTALSATSGSPVSGGLSALSKVTVSAPKKVGTAWIRSVATTEYSADLDLSKVAASEPTPEARALRELAAKEGITTVPLELWLDGSGRVRQLHATLPVKSAVAGRTVTVTVGVLAQAWDFGTAVTVAKPPASQVVRVPVSALGLGSSIL